MALYRENNDFIPTAPPPSYNDINVQYNQPGQNSERINGIVPPNELYHLLPNGVPNESCKRCKLFLNALVIDKMVKPKVNRDFLVNFRLWTEESRYHLDIGFSSYFGCKC